MGIFDGILLCTDLDDTLLTTDKRVSEENKCAIEYFKQEGGLFTFATGRVPLGMADILKQITPNAPVLCYNGAGIYDIEQKKLLWSLYLDDTMRDLCEYVYHGFPSAGIELCADDTVYFSKENYHTRRHQVLENFPDNPKNHYEVEDKIKKIIFMVNEDEMDSFKEFIKNSPFTGSFNFTRSSPWYYEALPPSANKGSALSELAGILDIPRGNVIAMGDNENDLPLIKAAGVGIAVMNAVDEVKAAADYITVDHNSSAAAAVIYALRDGKIEL